MLMALRFIMSFAVASPHASLNTALSLHGIPSISTTRRPLGMISGAATFFPGSFRRISSKASAYLCS